MGDNMSQYIALYRKFRPTTFDDVVGQEQVIKVLKHQIQNNQIGHAYLFCGSRGTGKTSTAKILSRAINCQNPKDGEPCNECDVCKGILSSSITDVMEIDAASNNSVDNIRTIRENVIYAPTLAKYKVYIIDEVHMLSTSAFNALLKTLEEPPENVIFILATTEPHKIPITILSRCQRFEFKRITKEDIAKRLRTVCEKNEVKATDEALMVIAQAADGALRDGLSLLDQIISSGVNDISEDIARELLGITKSSVTFTILNCIVNKDISTAISTVSDVVNSGKDIKYFVWEIISLARDILVYQATKDTSLVNNYSSLEQIEALSSIPKEKLAEIITYFSELENSIKNTTFPNVVLESALISFISNDGIPKPKVVQVATQSVNNVVQPKSPVQQNANPMPAQPQTESNVESKPVQQFSQSGDWKEVIKHLRDSGKMSLYATLVSTTANISNNTITINFAQAFGKTVVEKSDNMATLKNSINAVMGRDLAVKCVINGATNTAEDNVAENTLLKSGIDVNIV